MSLLDADDDFTDFSGVPLPTPSQYSSENSLNQPPLSTNTGNNILRPTFTTPTNLNINQNNTINNNNVFLNLPSSSIHQTPSITTTPNIHSSGALSATIPMSNLPIAGGNSNLPFSSSSFNNNNSNPLVMKATPLITSLSAGNSPTNPMIGIYPLTGGLENLPNKIENMQIKDKTPSIQNTLLSSGVPNSQDGTKLTNEIANLVSRNPVTASTTNSTTGNITNSPLKLPADATLSNSVVPFTTSQPLNGSHPTLPPLNILNDAFNDEFDDFQDVSPSNSNLSAVATIIASSSLTTSSKLTSQTSPSQNTTAPQSLFNPPLQTSVTKGQLIIDSLNAVHTNTNTTTNTSISSATVNNNSANTISIVPLVVAVKQEQDSEWKDGDDDEFGDFEDFTAAPPALPASATTDINTNISIPQPLTDSPLVSNAPSTVLTPSTSTPLVASNVQTTQQVVIPELISNQNLSSVLNLLNKPLSNIIEYCDTFNNTSSLLAQSQSQIENRIHLFNPEESEDQNIQHAILQISSHFETDTWYNEWNKIVSEETYNQHIVNTFRWRKSHTRKFLYKQMGVLVDEENIQKPNETATTHEKPADINTKMTGFDIKDMKGLDSPGTREHDLEEAKKLCQLTEDDLNNISDQDLQKLLERLVQLSKVMQEYTAYWLDAKEQLVMDAEMHNKMIASLVQYAQQQQLAASKGTSNNSSQKKPPLGKKSKSLKK